MAFDINNFFFNRATANSIGNANNLVLHSYESLDDDIATINSSGYFDGIATQFLRVGDAINVKGSDEPSFLAITSLDSPVTTKNISTELPPGSIGTTELADGAVTTPKLASEAVTTDKIALNGVTSFRLADMAVTNEKLALNSVSSNRIQDDAVTPTKIPIDSILMSKFTPMIKYTHRVIYGATYTTVGGSDTEVINIPGVFITANSLPSVSIQSGSIVGLLIYTVLPGTDQITVTFSVDPGNDTVLSIKVDNAIA